MIDLLLGDVVDLESIHFAQLLKRPCAKSQLTNDERALVVRKRVIPGCRVVGRKGDFTQIECGLGTWWLENELWKISERGVKHYGCTVKGELHYLEDFPYFPNNPPENDAQPWRFTQVACIAMCLAHLKLGGIVEMEDYEAVTDNYCLGRHHYYNKLAMRDLGVFALHQHCFGPDDVKSAIDRGQPFPVALVARGTWKEPHGLAYYVVIYGYDAQDWLVMDPFGELNVDSGLWLNKELGAGREVRYSIEKMDKRLFHQGGNSAWGWVNFTNL